MITRPTGAAYTVRLICKHCDHTVTDPTDDGFAAFFEHIQAHTIAPATAPTNRRPVACAVPGEQASTGTPAVPVLATTRTKETHE